MARTAYWVLCVVLVVVATQVIMRLYDSHGLLEAAGAFVLVVLVSQIVIRLIARTFPAENSEAS